MFGFRGCCLVMSSNDKKLEKSKVISVRIKGKNLALFNQMSVTPTQFFNYALKKYSEEFISSEKIELSSQIQSLIVDIHNHKVDLENKQSLLDKLRNDYDALELKEYNIVRDKLMPLLKERFNEDILSGKVDCVEDFIKQNVDFINLQAYYLKINQEHLNEIVIDFYDEESHQVDVDIPNILGNGIENNSH